MPSMLHEVLVDLIRENPEMLIPLLRGKLGAVELHGAHFGTDDHNYSQLPNLDADLVLKVHDRSQRLLCALIPEIQLSIDYEKERAWPAYQAGTHRRLNCPTFVVVIAVDPVVARWAAGPFRTGQTHFRPIVIGPKHLPIIVDPRHARNNVELAVLSGLAHCDEPEVEQIGEALWHALDQRSDGRSDEPAEGRSDRQSDHQSNPPSDRRYDLYWDLFLAAINEATRKHLMIRLGSYQPQSEWGKQIYAEGESKGLLEGERKGLLEGKRKGLLEGRREGQAAALTTLLQMRGLAPGLTVRERIEQCRNLKLLHQWLRRAVTATHLDEVFES
ncbi:MAG: hypothetical protein AAGF11_15025 [Myxococcota bacterium]